jgi:localization factor PodJL
LESPAFRASVTRAKLRQAQMLAADHPEEPAQQAPVPAPKPKAERRSALPGSGFGLLLAAGLTVFAAGGYLMVDALMTWAAHRSSPGIEHSARAIDPRAADGPAAEASVKLPTMVPGSADHSVRAAAPAQPAAPATSPEDGDSGPSSPAPSPTLASRVSAMGNAIVAVFRSREPAAPLLVEPAAVPPKDAPPPVDEATTLAVTALPMTIGPASLRQAALRGEAAAQFEIAARFATGLGVPRDLPEALRWYGRAAAQGMALAQYRLAMFYERGWGTPADPERARAWYARAAEQGNVKSMHNLAVISASGSRSDFATAARWFAQAADLGLADSQFNLAVLYQNGLGVPKDPRLAYKWLTLAARTGDREAASRLAEIKGRLTPDDLQEAEAMVAAWRARTPDPAVNDPAAVSLAP